MKILLVEDNIQIARNIVQFLSLKDHHVVSLLDWSEFLYTLSKEHFDSVILDIQLPWKDWFTLLDELRKAWKNLPVLILTSQWTQEDIVKWLRLWSDDYLTKPFHHDELLARLETIIRRDFSNKSSQLSVLDISVNLETKKAYKNNFEVSLSALEYQLLVYLLQNAWKTISRQDILDSVWWWFEKKMFSRTVDMYISYLRKKFWNEFIITKKWLGYEIPN